MIKKYSPRSPGILLVTDVMFIGLFLKKKECGIDRKERQKERKSAR